LEGPDWIVIWKVPLVTPCAVPVEVKSPVVVVPSAKHDDGATKLNLVMLTALPLCVSVAVKQRDVVPWGLARPASQFPWIGSMLLEPPPPQAKQASAREKTIAVPKRFIGILREEGRIISDRSTICSTLFGVLFHTLKIRLPLSVTSGGEC
jgi:hypothetical protein